eukprot:jgi/Mesvir1/29652/Mv21494-RA.1
MGDGPRVRGGGRAEPAEGYPLHSSHPAAQQGAWGGGTILPGAKPVAPAPARAKAAKCPKCRHRTCRCSSSSISSGGGSSSSDSSSDSGRRSSSRRRRDRLPGRADPASGQVLAVPMTKGVALPGTATSIPWEVEDYRYKLRVLPEYLQTAKDRYGGSLRARLEGLKPMFIRGPGQTSGWQSRERMDIAVNLCHALDVAVKELGVTAVTELACMEYFARIVESLMVVESERGQGAWVAQAAFVLPVVESGSQRTRAARRALKAAKKEHDARVSAAVLAKVDGGAVASSSTSNKQK